MREDVRHAWRCTHVLYSTRVWHPDVSQGRDLRRSPSPTGARTPSTGQRHAPVHPASSAGSHGQLLPGAPSTCPPANGREEQLQGVDETNGWSTGKQDEKAKDGPVDETGPGALPVLQWAGRETCAWHSHSRHGVVTRLYDAQIMRRILGRHSSSCAPSTTAASTPTCRRMQAHCGPSPSRARQEANPALCSCKVW